MNNISFGQFVPGNSWIYKLDPRTKILLTISLIVLIFLIPNLLGMVIALGVYILIFLTTRIPFMKVLKGLKGIMFLLMFTVILQLIYTKSTTDAPLYTFNMSIGLFQTLIIVGILLFYFLTKKYIKFKLIYLLVIVFLIFIVLWNNPFEKWEWNFNFIWTSFNFDIYEAGISKAGFVFIRIVLMIGITSLLTLTTMSTDINNGLEWILAPLKLFKIPVSVFAMLVSLTLRFIPTLLEESKKIMNAQASRGVDFQEGKLSDKVNQIISLLIPMFVISFKRADDLSNAMEARGYIIGGKRTKLDELKFRWRDYMCDTIVILLFTFVIWSRFYV
ncbi:MAG: energy-coupling factor transporter transmembrane component T family protein [Anaeroplasma sp.]